MKLVKLIMVEALGDYTQAILILDRNIVVQKN
jgi:hypothetical protein